MGLQNFDESNAFAQVRYIIAGTGTSIVDFTNSNGVPFRIDALVATNNDSIAHVVNVYYFDGATPGLLGSVSVPSGAGTLGTPGVDLLPAVLPASVVGLVCGPVSKIQGNVAVAVTGGNSVQVTALGGYF